ncbi:LOW QUALITY PROTEIN: hypothetical protein ACHAXT_007630 [Thalassiosira profunda]
MKRMQEEGFLDEERTWSISDLPPPLHGTDGMFATIPEASSCPMWAQQLLSDWGEVSEAEAMRRASNSASTSGTNNEPSDSSPLTEKGSKDTKLSPYLRYGVISPQRAAEAGVRVRDLLWRDWSHICFGLLGPIRRGDAVLEFLDEAWCPLSKTLGVEEEDLFYLWCVGNTGSKLVDAGMRQLWKEGWMPRKMRILSAACLVEGLGFCGVDPFYAGTKWEASPGSEGEDGAYVERWHNEELSESLQQKSSRGQRRREKHYKRKACTRPQELVANMRVAWPGLGQSENAAAVEEGEVMGVGLTPVDELRIRAQ